MKVFALFSGGHDSLCSTHVASGREDFAGVVHINTGIGIEQTWEFVRETCTEHGWPLHELHSDASYEDLVMERGGFPCGPKSHSSMLWHLKQKPLRAFVQEQKEHRRDRIGLVSGIRRQESVRRMGAGISKPTLRIGSQVWINPILDWTKVECGRYIKAQRLRRNPVSDALERSGECLCGALARRGELRDIELWYPEVGKRIRDLEQRAKDAGLDEHFWGMRSPVSADQLELDGEPLCTSCVSAILDGEGEKCPTCGGTDREGGTVATSGPDEFGNYETDDCPDDFHR